MTIRVPSRIWPERWLHSAKTDPAPVRLISPTGQQYTDTTLGRFLWPDDEEFWMRLGSKVPEGPVDLAMSAFGELTRAAFSSEFSGNDFDRITSSFCREAWHCIKWQASGRRLYALDETTTLALLHTKIDDIPIETLHLPAPSIYIRPPPTLNWTVDVDPRPFIDNPHILDPEPSQPFEGFMVSGQYEKGELAFLHVIVCAKARRTQQDNIHWFYWDVRRAITLGNLIHSEMVGDPVEWPGTTPKNLRDVPHHFLGRDEAMELFLGSILYITSANPYLEAVPNLRQPTKRHGKHEKRWRRYQSATKASITWVGGPLEGIRQSRMRDPGSLMRKPPRPHLRAGHYRRSRVGTREKWHYEHRWIKPIAVGDWDRVVAWKTLQGFGLSLKKTRPAHIKEEESSV